MLTTLDLLKGSPFGQYERVTVTFPVTPNTDLVIPHSLVVVAPETIEFYPTRLSAAGIIYVDLSATRKPWTSSYIVLRANVASLQANILLGTPRKFNV